jgi:hypothetical protein
VNDSRPDAGELPKGVPGDRGVPARLMRSRACQAAGVVLAFVFVGALHAANDGLWPDVDAARHALHGLFWSDYLSMLPREPVAFAASYYARYPAIAPATYPPLFYLLEALAFAVVGPSPHVAKLLVLAFAAVAGLYTMAWCRRWVGSTAGWAGAMLAFLPGFVVWSNAVMLNIPAVALGLAALYHLRRWLEDERPHQLVSAGALFAATVLTYYPGGVVLGIGAAWVLGLGGRVHLDRRTLWIGVLALIAVLPLVASLVVAPVHTTRNLPTLRFLSSGATWTYYWRVLPDLAGVPVLGLGLAGALAGLATRPWRSEAAYVLGWMVVLLVGVSPLPVRDPRYVLLVAPALIVGATIGIAVAARSLPRLTAVGQAAAVACVLAVGAWAAAGVRVPMMSGVSEVAAYLKERAPRDAVLYDGRSVWAFAFHVRALDPAFERRVARADKLLYQFGPTTTFEYVEEAHVESTDDVIDVLRARCGCRWVAIEVASSAVTARGRQLLREAVTRPDFELVRSFPVTVAGAERRVDLYRLVHEVEDVATLELSFPAFSNRRFPSVAPITR